MYYNACYSQNVIITNITNDTGNGKMQKEIDNVYFN